MARTLLMVPAFFLGAGLLAWSANWLTSRAWRRAASAHWSERARLLWPARQGAASNIFLLPVGICLLVSFMDHGFSIWCVLDGVATWLGLMLGTYPLDRQILPRLTFRQWLRLAVIVWSMRIAMIGLWVNGCLLMPEDINGCSFIIVGGVLATHIAFVWRYWRLLLIKTRLLLRAGDRLQGIVTATAYGMSLPLPKTFLLDVPVANAMALPLTRELIFTSRLMEICGDKEVSSICAHELAHLTESKSVAAMRVMSSVVWFPILFLRPLLHAYGTGGLAILSLSFAARALFRKLSRRMERRADAMATTQQGDSGVYARALEKLYRENQMPAVNSSSRKTHPHLYDRMLAAGIQPDFERPKPPATLSAIYLPLWMGLGMLIGWALASSS